MNTVEQKFQKEIDAERLWLASEHGCFTFFSMLPVAVLIVIGFWDAASHIGLIVWFILNRAINLARWKIFDYYHANKAKLAADINKFKNLVLFVSILHGLSWAFFVVWFLFPFDPTKFLLVTLALIIEIMGALLFWYSFLPALIAITLPITIALVYVLILQGGQLYLISAIIIFIACLLGFMSSLKLSEVLRYSLFLYFENAALRRDFQEKSMLLETALENMGQGICMADKEDRLRLWNRQFVNLFGEAGEQVKIDTNLCSLMHAARPPMQINPEGQTIYHLDDENVFEVRQSELEPGGRVITFTDITDLMRRERSLKNARKEAIEANCAKIRFLATASHDLRQPIHALGLFFAELAERVRSPQTDKLISQMEDSIEAINTMLNALLDVSKLDAGIVKPELKICSLEEILARLNAEFQPIAKESYNRLKVRLARVPVLTDPAMLERMLRNLISNALRHTENGRVLVGARRRGGEIEIQILDSGRGIPENQFEEIFVEFHQLHNPQRDRRQGLGLGLAIVKRLANLLGYEVKVSSTLGQGSCFSIRLPIAFKTPIMEMPLSDPANSVVNQPLTGCRLLVLDDDIAVRESMNGLLSHWGCEVISAGTPQEAKKKLTGLNAKLDFLIVDYRLTENVSGIDAARDLQKCLAYPAEVLIITGDTEPERLQEAEASSFPLLHKPVHPAKLRSTLQHLLAKSVKALH